MNAHVLLWILMANFDWVLIQVLPAPNVYTRFAVFMSFHDTFSLTIRKGSVLT